MQTVEYREEAKRKQTFWERLRSIPIPRKKHTVIFWDSPEVLPYGNASIFNRHFVTSLGIGSTYDAFSGHAQKVIDYIGASDLPSAIQAVKNQQACFYNALTNYSPKGLAGAALIYSIDGVVCTHFDDDALQVTLDKLTEIGFTFGMMNDAIDLVKKK
jgi:hypothetical protein